MSSSYLYACVGVEGDRQLLSLVRGGRSSTSQSPITALNNFFCLCFFTDLLQPI